MTVMKNPTQLTEKEVRALRDLVYEVPMPDKSWEVARKSWMLESEIRWLQETAEEMKSTEMP